MMHSRAEHRFMGIGFAGLAPDPAENAKMVQHEIDVAVGISGTITGEWASRNSKKDDRLLVKAPSNTYEVDASRRRVSAGMAHDSADCTANEVD